MATLEVYDSQGNLFDPTDEVTGQRDRIKQLALASVRVLAEPDKRKVTGYFVAKKSKHSRGEQFYAEYTDSSSTRPFADFLYAVTTQTEAWDFELDRNSDAMDVFELMENKQWNSVPGTQREMDQIKKLVSLSGVTTVGVNSPKGALSLSREFGAKNTVAIMHKEKFEAISMVDIAIVIGDYSGIQPLGKTAERLGISDESDGTSAGKTAGESGFDRLA